MLVKKFSSLFEALSWVQSYEGNFQEFSCSPSWKEYSFRVVIKQGGNAGDGEAIKEMIAKATKTFCLISEARETERWFSSMFARKYGVSVFANTLTLDEVFDLVPNDTDLLVSRDGGGRYTTQANDILFNL